MKNKYIQIGILSVSILIFLLCLYLLINQNTISASNRSSWTTESTYMFQNIKDNKKTQDIKMLRDKIQADPSIIDAIFDTKIDMDDYEENIGLIENLLVPESEISDENYNGPGYFAYKTNNELFYTYNGVGILQVEEEANYSYKFNVLKNQPSFEGYLWTLEDINGNTLLAVTDTSQSAQETITLQPGVYFLYENWPDNESEIGLEIKFHKH